MGFKDFIFYDDDKANIKIAKSLKDIQGVTIKTTLVKPTWK